MPLNHKGVYTLRAPLAVLNGLEVLITVFAAWCLIPPLVLGYEIELPLVLGQHLTGAPTARNLLVFWLLLYVRLHLRSTGEKPSWGSRLHASATPTRTGIVLFMVLSLVYLNAAVARVWPSGDTIPGKLVPVSIITDGDLELSEFYEGVPHARRYGFWRVGDNIYSAYPIAPSLTVLPVYGLASLFFPEALSSVREVYAVPGADDLPNVANLLEQVSSALITALAVVLFWVLARKVTRDGPLALWLAVALGLGTSLMSTAALALWQHGPACLSLAVMLLCLYRAVPGVWPFRKVKPASKAGESCSSPHFSDFGLQESQVGKWEKWLWSAAVHCRLVQSRPAGEKAAVNCRTPRSRLRGSWGQPPDTARMPISRSIPLLLIAAGFAAGWAYACRPAVMPVLPLAALWTVKRFRFRAVYFLLPCAAVGLAVFAYNWTFFGKLTGGYARNLGIFSSVDAKAVLTMLFSPSRGLFFFSPFLLFALPGLVRACRRPIQLDGLCAYSVLGILVLFAFWSTWAAGSSFGSRYLCEATFLLVVVLAFHGRFLMRRRWVFEIFLLAVLFSCHLHIVGAREGDAGWTEHVFKPDDIAAAWSWRDSQVNYTLTR